MSVGKGNLLSRWKIYFEVAARRGRVAGFGEIQRFAASLIALLLVVGVLTESAGAVSSVTSGTTVTDTYNYTGNTETFTVPANVTQLSVTVTGAEGGQGGLDASGTAPPGGYQGVVTGTIAVTPGEALTIGVGQGGADSPVWDSCSTGASQPTGDPNDAVGGTNPLGGYGGGAGGSPGPSGCSGYGGSGGAASVVEIGTTDSPSSVATIVGAGSGGSGGSGQFPPTLGQISLPTFTARPDETSTTGQDGESVYTACTQVSGEQCDGGGGAGGGGGVQGGSAGFVEFGANTSDEWFGLGGYPGENSSGGFGTLSSMYNYYSDDNADGSVVISYSTGSPSAPSNVNGTPGNASVALYWSAPASSGETAIASYAVQYATSPFASWTTATMCTSAQTSCTVTGLTNGVAYDFEVAATNSVGEGGFSDPSSALTPSGPPGAPVIETVTPSDGSLSVSFTAASSSLPVTDYEYSLDGGLTWVSSGVTSSPLLISGLTNGTQYTLELQAVSAAGPGADSSPVSATPSALPGAPTITTITPGGDGTSLSVDFLPGYTGGSRILGYQYATSVGAGTNAFGAWTDASGTTSPLSITNLSNGTTYSVELRAVNADGDGPGSIYMVGATLTVPDTPTVTSLTPGNSSIQVAYTPYTSVNDGGSAISGVDYSLDGGSTWVSAGTLSDPFTISSLTNGTTYGIVLRADNGVGTSPTSSSSSATPLTLPGAPTQVLVSGASASGSVSWSSPIDDGGSPVLGYTASAFSAPSGGSAVSSCSSATLNCVVSGLTDDTTYYFSVTATNAAGTGLVSSPRVSALPVALPGAPTVSTLSAGNAYLAVPFSAGTFDTNDSITGYQYSLDGGVTWQSATGTTSPITISGLTNGTTYNVALRATSNSGAGATSNIEVGTPYAAPDATANVTTSYVAGSGQVTVSWLAPNDNGAAISSYTVTAFTAAIGGSQQSACTTSTLSCTLTGLSNGTTYYISIQSVNIYSQYSLRSSPLIPVVPGSTSSVSMVASPTSTAYGALVTLTATATSGATGTVDFDADGVTIDSCGAVTLVSSVAQCVTSSLSVGTDELQAFYSGDGTYASSVSPTYPFVVNAADQSALTLSSVATTFAPSPSNNTSLTTSGGTTGGALDYVVSGTDNTAGCFVSGATLNYVGAGTCTITATMAGNASYNAVSSVATTFTVDQASSGTTLSALPTSSTFGQSVTLAATVSPDATGTIDFEVGGASITSCDAVAIVAQSAQCVTTTLSTGVDSLQAIYSGDDNYLTSSSSPFSFVVNDATQSALSVTSIAGTTGFDLTLTVSGGSGSGALSYVVASGTATCSQPSPGVLRAVGAGTCVVTAAKASDANYDSVTSNATTVTFSQLQTLSFTSTAPSGAVVGDTYVPVARSTATLAVTVTVDPSSAAVCSLNAGTVTFVESGTCVLDANQAGDVTTVAAAQVQQRITVRAREVGAVPSPPRNVTATSGTSGVVVTWSTPTSSGSGPILDYVVRVVPGGGGCTTTTSSCALTGLTPGTSYVISVVALNATGSSTPDTTTFLYRAAGATSATSPSPPLEVKVSIGSHGTRVSWTAPASNGGATITGYVVTASPGDVTCTTSTTSCTFSGLHAGTAYTFKVVAKNSNGTSSPGTFTMPKTRPVTPVTHFSIRTNFAFGSSVLSAHDRSALSQLAERVVRTKIHSLTLLGFTDDVGSLRFNEVLSSERARAVGRYLMAQVHRRGYRALTLHELGRGVLTSSSNHARDRTVEIEA